MNRTNGIVLLLILLGLAAGVFLFQAEPASPASQSLSGEALALPALELTPQALDLSALAVATVVQPTLPPAPPPTAALLGTPTPLPIAVPPAAVQASGNTGAALPVDLGPVATWNPPALEVPIARHPNDHYWMIRPVEARYRNSGLPYYPYGSDGPGNNLRIHHGIDISNPIGVEIMAAADGSVIWADKGHFNELEGITSYGNTVVIQHDFGFEGQTVYTLYAHMATILVAQGDRVDSGDVIGLIGNTGQVSGPHVHFEVRVGRNWYFAVRNPELWIAPYVDTGVVAGRLEFSPGNPIFDTEVTLTDLSTGFITHRTSTYAGRTVTADEHWDENWLIPDVPSGRYLVSASFGTQRWEVELQVLAGTTNWAELQPVSAP